MVMTEHWQWVRWFTAWKLSEFTEEQPKGKLRRFELRESSYVKTIQELDELSDSLKNAEREIVH